MSNNTEKEGELNERQSGQEDNSARPNTRAENSVVCEWRVTTSFRVSFLTVQLKRLPDCDRPWMVVTFSNNPSLVWGTSRHWHRKAGSSNWRRISSAGGRFSGNCSQHDLNFVRNKNDNCQFKIDPFICIAFPFPRLLIVKSSFLWKLDTIGVQPTAETLFSAQIKRKQTICLRRPSMKR